MASPACSKQCIAFPLGTALQMLGLALMIGGMLALGAFTAPVVFGQLPRAEAGPIMAVIFRRYDIVLIMALGLSLLGEALRLRSGQTSLKCKLNWLRYLLLAGLTGGILFSGLKLNADIERMNQAGWHRDDTARGRQFDLAHKLSESLYKIDLLAAVLLILLTPFATRSTSEATLKPQSETVTHVE